MEEIEYTVFWYEHTILCEGLRTGKPIWAIGGSDSDHNGDYEVYKTGLLHVGVRHTITIFGCVMTEYSKWEEIKPTQHASIDVTVQHQYFRLKNPRMFWEVEAIVSRKSWFILWFYYRMLWFLNSYIQSNLSLWILASVVLLSIYFYLDLS